MNYNNLIRKTNCLRLASILKNIYIITVELGTDDVDR